MSFSDWLAESRTRVCADGFNGVKESAYQLYVGAWRNLGRRINYGNSVLDGSWDVLVVLDACRWDLMREVQSNCAFVDFTNRYSTASSSEEWMRKTFGEADTSDIGYITANPFSREEINRNDFNFVDEVWEYAFDEEVETVPPSAVTDRAIHANREKNADRLILHYMQPHYPFIPCPVGQGISIEDFGENDTDDIWDKLRRNEVSHEVVWKAYRANLEHVLNSVSKLLQNIDGDVVITADHGNLLGEFGLYGHPDYVPIPALKRVPWCRTQAEDLQSYEPPSYEQETVKNDPEELLRDLGYK